MSLLDNTFICHSLKSDIFTLYSLLDNIFCYSLRSDMALINNKFICCSVGSDIFTLICL